MEEFAEKLEGFSPDLVVVGGLQMMDNFPFQSGMEKLDLNSFASLCRQCYYCFVIVFICKEPVAAAALIKFTG